MTPQYSTCCCGSAKARPLFSNKVSALGKRIPGAKSYSRPFEVVRCQECGLTRIEPPAYTSDDAFEHYQSEMTEFYASKKAEHFSYARFLFEYITPHLQSGRILDVGCGPGYTVQYSREQGFQAEGIEINQALCRFATEQVLTGIYAEPIEDYAPKHAAEYDAVILNHVLEHIPEPVAFLRLTSEVLKPGGLVVLAVPNFNGFPSRLMRNHWYGLLPDTHIWQFTPETLAQVASAAGLQIVKTDARSVMGTNYFSFRPPGLLNAILFRSVMPLVEKIGLSDQAMCVARKR